MYRSDLGFPRRLMRSFSHGGYELEPMYRRRAGLGIGGLLLLGCLLGITLWAWPEMQRTMRIHRM